MMIISVLKMIIITMIKNDDINVYNNDNDIVDIYDDNNDDNNDDISNNYLL